MNLISAFAKSPVDCMTARLQDKESEVLAHAHTPTPTSTLFCYPELKEVATGV